MALSLFFSIITKALCLRIALSLRIFPTQSKTSSPIKYHPIILKQRITNQVDSPQPSIPTIMALTLSHTLPKMMRKDFLAQLPEVHDLTDDDKCPLCLAKYRPSNPPAPGIMERLASTFIRQNPEPIDTDFEIAVRLPCQHVLGLNCMERWVSPQGGQTTCPYVSPRR